MTALSAETFAKRNCCEFHEVSQVSVHKRKKNYISYSYFILNCKYDHIIF